MIINTSIACQAKPYTLGKEEIDFFNLSGIKQEHIHLNTTIDSEIIILSVPHALAKALFYGALNG